MTLAGVMASSSPLHRVVQRRLHEELIPKQLPIEPRISQWTRDEDELVRALRFTTRSAMRSFVVKLLELEDSVDHHSRVAIDGNDVSVRVSTHGAGVTVKDIKFAALVDRLLERSDR